MEVYGLEEKQAIESLKNIAIYIGDNYTFSQQGIRNLRENLKIVLPVIEKQSKEIEELKEFKKQVEEIESTNFIKYKNYISKDKIKSKIEEYEEKIKRIKEKDVWEEPYDSEKYVRYTNYISVLQSLLEKE